MEWINLAALVIIPILAVIIAQYLQDRSEKRKDKMRVFSHLMSYRSFGYVDQYSVNVFNSVPIVFYDDKDVIEKYNAYLKSLNIKPEDVQVKQKEIEDNKTKMLEAMAKALKYKKHKEFFNEQAKQVIEFCKQNKKAYHIKNGTITE